MHESTLKGTLLLGDLGLTNVRQEAGMGRATLRVVLAGFVQAQGAVHGQAHFAGVSVLLAIVLPPADRAQRQCAGRLQRLVSAARAAITSFHNSPRYVDESQGLQVYTKGQLLAPSL